MGSFRKEVPILPFQQLLGGPEPSPAALCIGSEEDLNGFLSQGQGDGSASCPQQQGAESERRLKSTRVPLAKLTRPEGGRLFLVGMKAPPCEPAAAVLQVA